MCKLMYKLEIGVACCLMLLLCSCKSRPQETFSDVENSPFKVIIRSQEFGHSGTVNIDICVAQVSDRDFPKKSAQCFFHGFDLSGLSVKWHSQRLIEVSFASGWVSFFRNYAFVYPKESDPVEFHTTLCDGCKTMPGPS
jgi:hypothetical protein